MHTRSTNDQHKVPWRDRLFTRAAATARSRWFGHAVIASIATNVTVLALETDAAFSARHVALLGWLHATLVAVLAAELGVRLLAHGTAWRAFFADGWTRFDLAVLAASLLPAVGPIASIARLARILRVVRVVSVSPKLRLVVQTMARSIPSLAHVGLLLGLLLFIYGVLGVHLFRGADPAHWGDLGTALLTLFQILTLEGWVELQRASMTAEPWAWVFYTSFVLLAVFVMVNLFIAVVMASFDQARRDLGDPSSEPTPADVLRELRALRAELAGLRRGAGSCEEGDPSRSSQSSFDSSTSTAPASDLTLAARPRRSSCHVTQDTPSPAPTAVPRAALTRCGARGCSGPEAR